MRVGKRRAREAPVPETCVRFVYEGTSSWETELEALTAAYRLRLCCCFPHSLSQLTRLARGPAGLPVTLWEHGSGKPKYEIEGLEKAAAQPATGLEPRAVVLPH